jgi:arginine N-succinyltransferase
VFVVREARVADLPHVLRLAELLDSVNLPADGERLEAMLADSEAAHRGLLPPEACRYVFALEDASRRAVVGLSMIIAAHGTPADPHHYFQLDVDERYSPVLDEVFRHRTMRLKQGLTPHTELGALVLDPSLRGRPERLGRTLSYARLLFIAAHRAAFCDRVQAELLPPFDEDGTSRLWSWLGEKFTGLTYQQADRLSRSHHDFIRTLFPSEAIYVSLMPEDVQAVIGAVGEGTRGVERMLRDVGFIFNDHIDPFDGGPHFEAETDAIALVRGAREAMVCGITSTPSTDGLVGAFGYDGAPVRVVRAGFTLEGDEVRLPDEVALALSIAPGETVFCAPL